MAKPCNSPRRSGVANTAATPVIAALVTTLLGGCLSLAPRYERPAPPVADVWPQDASTSPATPAARPASGLDWREYFADPRLRVLIETALANNRDLRVALARVEQARAVYGIQRADQLPSLGVGGNQTRQRLPGDLSLTGNPYISSQYQVGLGLSTWELDFWGRIRNLKDAALDDYLASDAARRALALSLVSQVAQTWLSLREFDERIALAQQTVDSRAESLRIFTRREQVGATSKLDLTEVTTLWQQARALVAQLQQQRAAQAHALQVLVGAPIDTSPAALDTTVDDARLMRDLDPGLPSSLLEDRPDIIAAEYQLRAAHANIGAARAAFFPQITLTGSVGTASSALDGLFKAGSAAWTFTPSLSLPIFQGGRLVNNLDLAEARRVESVANYEKTIQGAFRDVADALSARRWLADQVTILQATQDAQAERARLAKLRYDHGAAAFLEVLDAQRDLLAIEQQTVQTRRALLSARVSLYTALGGGSRLMPPAHAPGGPFARTPRLVVPPPAGPAGPARPAYTAPGAHSMPEVSPQ
ncbi:efflux transporter outer membrane subunit [Pandoraea sp. XY-2]|uniref:efflux transporter outer membrane subunit n=1 Tax=Pandoraea sp. XY-2 TaxID=2518599 RepID=UPI00101B1C31|nr:efflux transporter outer membrane subunit [Pandoraea sp. XY-2]QBC33196.1 RND transporter [Pandoraea sp. XY-2]